MKKVEKISWVCRIQFNISPKIRIPTFQDNSRVTHAQKYQQCPMTIHSSSMVSLRTKQDYKTFKHRIELMRREQCL
jgi:aminoglycoside phosphotransferase